MYFNELFLSKIPLSSLWALIKRSNFEVKKYAATTSSNQIQHRGKKLQYEQFM